MGEHGNPVRDRRSAGGLDASAASAAPTAAALGRHDLAAGVLQHLAALDHVRLLHRDVLPAATGKAVLAGTADEPVPARPADQLVATAASVEAVVTGAALDHVRAIGAVYDVAVAGAP